MLEICRGRTDYPMRPVRTPRFLIGSSPRCDLRLGDESLPALLAFLVVDGRNVWLETMPQAPAVHINGQPQTSIPLVDKDHIRIGAFEFVVHLAAQTNAAPIPVETSDPNETRHESAANDLTIAELVERIEAATNLVEDFEGRRRLGMAALVAAVDNRDLSFHSDFAETVRGAVLPMSGASATVPALPIGDLESLIAQLAEVVAGLEGRSTVPRRREAGLQDPAFPETHDRLLYQVENLLGRVAALTAGTFRREPGRASA
jgi:hypothetical protein